MSQAMDILLVEDDPHDVDLTLRAMREHNLTNRIVVARDGAEALDTLFGADEEQPRCRPRFVLLDLKLPKVDGLEVLRRIKSDDRTRSMPVVVLTSSRESPDLEAAYDLGVNSYLCKPVEFDDFVRVVGQVGLYWLLLNEQNL